MTEKELSGPEAEYIAVKAVESGVSIIGLTRGEDTRSHHIEKLDAGEVLVAQFTEKTSAIKIKGNAEIYTKFGKIICGK
jgi:transcription attenuation protein (tryptophan RNA-binding attenuator protein)